MTNQILAPEPARLGELLIEAWRMARVLQGEYRAVAELLQLTLELLRESDMEREQIRARYRAVLDENRNLRAQLRDCRKAA